MVDDKMATENCWLKHLWTSYHFKAQMKRCRFRVTSALSTLFLGCRGRRATPTEIFTTQVPGASQILLGRIYDGWTTLVKGLAGQ